MKSPYLFLVTLILLFSTTSCEKEEGIDKQKPEISLDMTDAFPKNCDTIYFGETFDLKVLFTDNVALGSFNIDIHHNFDHHSHSTEVNNCVLDPVKSPVNPFTLIRDYTIPAGLTAYETNIAVEIPSGNMSGLFDDGDYHFFISLTDKEGWSAQKGLSIKMLHR
jgi:hypothetical protein